MFWLTTLSFVSIARFVIAAVADCPDLEFWNGTSCTSCSNCPPESGINIQCSAKQDTECQRCWPGYDYSNTTGQEPCILCSQGSNCLNGNPRVTRNCTTISPTVCDGCADENFFDPFAGPDGGCVECKPPCGIFEVETIKCNTAHDRKCRQQWTIQAILTTLVPKVHVTTPADIPSSTTVYGAAHPYTEDAQRDQPEEKPLEKKPWLWAIISVVVVIIAVPAIVGISIAKRRKRKRRKNNDPRPPARVEQTRPLMPCGLDVLVRDLSIDDKKCIAKRLNVQDVTYGFYYWKIVAENVGLKDESTDWGRADNPTEKLLTAFGEKEEGTIRNLIKAIKDAGLTLFAKEMEQKFNKTGEDGGEERVASSWV